MINALSASTLCEAFQITAAERADDHALRLKGDTETLTWSEYAGVNEAVTAAVASANEHLSRPEQIKRFALLGVDWLPGGDELTPTAKLRRKAIAAKYQRQIDALYEDD
ncbi:MAG: hypothetical protein ACRDY7_06725 [Acidimicrobiia bacterium]